MRLVPVFTLETHNRTKYKCLPKFVQTDKASSSIKTAIVNRRISNESSSRRIMRLEPVFTLETHNRTNYKCLPKFVQTDNASSSIKTANKCLGYHGALVE